MSLSVVAGRSHSGFRAAVYGIHFDPWGFDTLLYFVKMVAVFCFNGCRELTFFVYAKELPAEDCTTLTFTPLRESILRLWRAPSLRDYSLRDYLTFAFTPLRESILRLWRAPSLRGYPLRTSSFSLSYRFEGPSCAFGAPLLQGATHFGTISLSLSHRFEDPSSAFSAPLL